MEKIRIDTTQNVAIEYQAAGLGERFIAGLIDYLILGIYLIAASYFMNPISTILPDWAMILVVVFPVWLYHFLCELFMNGQSIGKRQMNIKVIHINGTAVSFASYFIRWLFRVIDVFMTFGGLAVLVIVINGKGQRLGDMAAGTAVVSLKSRKELSDTLFEFTDEDYLVTFRQAQNLNDKDVSLIKELMKDAKSTGNNQVILALVDKVKSLLGIESNLPPRIFLDTIIKDYNHLNS
ncbi:MAG: RDD family protein [Chitinophagales bacterium]